METRSSRDCCIDVKAFGVDVAYKAESYCCLLLDFLFERIVSENDQHNQLKEVKQCFKSPNFLHSRNIQWNSVAVISENFNFGNFLTWKNVFNCTPLCCSISIISTHLPKSFVKLTTINHK